MKKFTKIILVLGACASAITLLAKPTGGSHGTDILHYGVRVTMSNDGVESNAVGSVQAHQNKQGNADNQQLNLSVGGLTAGTTYELLANGDTNLSDGVSFTTDANGGASLQYRSQGNGHGQGLGHGKSPLPAAFNPVSSLTQLDVFNASTQAVLTADMTMPNQLQYLIKRDLSTNNVDASLRIHATTAQTQFDLMASGLNPTNNYLLVVNGSVVQTETTDSSGDLSITTLPVSGSILDVRSLQVWDASSNVVLTTSLP
jgi:hypothetical protein